MAASGPVTSPSANVGSQSEQTQTQVQVQTQTQSSKATSSPAHHGSNIGAIVGGAVGGLGGLSLIGLAGLWLFLKSRQRQQGQQLITSPPLTNHNDFISAFPSDINTLTAPHTAPSGPNEDALSGSGSISISGSSGLMEPLSTVFTSGGLATVSASQSPAFSTEMSSTTQQSLTVSAPQTLASRIERAPLQSRNADGDLPVPSLYPGGVASYVIGRREPTYQLPVVLDEDDASAHRRLSQAPVGPVSSAPDAHVPEMRTHGYGVSEFEGWESTVGTRSPPPPSYKTERGGFGQLD